MSSLFSLHTVSPENVKLLSNKNGKASTTWKLSQIDGYRKVPISVYVLSEDEETTTKMKKGNCFVQYFFGEKMRVLLVEMCYFIVSSTLKWRVCVEEIYITLRNGRWRRKIEEGKSFYGLKIGHM